MKRIILILFLLSSLAWAGTYTANSASYADVNACVTGTGSGSCASHAPADGDVINIPAGSATWTSGVTAPSGIGITIIGSGTPNSGSSTTGASSSCSSGTTITLAPTATTTAFTFAPSYGNSTTRLSCMTLNYSSGPAIGWKILGTCTSSGCPNFRSDNINYTNWGQHSGAANNGYGINASGDVFGVIDHNTIVGTSGYFLQMVEVSNASYLGVETYGDNSWAQPEAYGSANFLYFEYNSLTYAGLTENEASPGGGTNWGGGRAVGRYNTFTMDSLNASFAWHGTESAGRPRGGRAWEFYGNTINCPSGAYCQEVLGMRSGTGLTWNNTVNFPTGSGINSFQNLDTYRILQNIGGWGACDGGSPYDTNDGITYYSGTISSISGSPYTYTINVSGTPGWATNYWTSGSGPSPEAGGPYALHDVTQTTATGASVGAEITSNGSASLVVNTWNAQPFVAGDSIQILRATQCIDQAGGRGAGFLYTGTNGNGNATPQQAAAEAVSPNYVWMVNTTGTATIPYIVYSNTAKVIANRDYFAETQNQAAQSSPTASFSGMGHGASGNKPSSCSVNQAYWDTTNNELWKCTATNTWSVFYTPYTNPHPLDGGSGGTNYSLTVTAGSGGSVTGTNCSTGSYPAGTFSCTAVPNSGYSFTGWTATGSASCTTANPCSFTLGATTTLAANFTATGVKAVIGVQIAGSAKIGASGGGGGGGLNARVDNCETGSESQCTAQGGTGSPLTNLGRYAALGFTGTVDTAPAIGPSGTAACSGLAQPANGQYPCSSLASPPYTLSYTFTDSSNFGTTYLRATDYSLVADCGTAFTSFNLGASGDAGNWSSGSDKLIIGSVAGGTYGILSINESAKTSTVSDLCGQSILPGNPVFSMANDSTLYTVNTDKESTVLGSVTSGTCVTPETMTQASTGSHGTMAAINPATLFQFSSSPSGSPNGTNVWTGGTSGCTFTPTAAPTTFTYANTIYKGVISGSTPATWTILWSLLFNFNYVSGLGSPYFPSGSGTCMPAAWPANSNGTFYISNYDSLFTINFSTTGQSTTGTSTTGPIYQATYTPGSGCSAWNTFTDVVTGDWGATGSSMTNLQANIITGTISGTFATPSFGVNGETLTQASTGATTVLFCTWNGTNCSTSSLTGLEVGNIFGTADATHTWTGGTSGATIAPSGTPAAAPFYFPALIHDSNTERNPAAGSEVTMVQMTNGKVSGTPAVVNSSGSTTISLSNSVNISPNQQTHLYNLLGANDQYLNCTTANNCPVWTVTATTGTTITIADSVGTGYSNSESQSGCGNACPTLSPYGPPMGINNGYSYFPEPWMWVPGTTQVGLCLSPSCQGHAAVGYLNSYRAKLYTAHAYLNMSLPCSVNGPGTPCPIADELPLLATATPTDQHGTYNNAGTTDANPVGMITTNVCGLTSACPSYGSSTWDELILVQNVATNSPLCNYSTANPKPSGGPFPNGCVYREGYSYNTMSSWNFDVQNAIGQISPDGKMFAFPSDMGLTTGCQNGTTNCWSSYVGAGPANATVTSITAPVCSTQPCSVTVTAANNFCATGTYVGTAQTGGLGMPCGSLAEQVTLPSGMTGNNAWLNGLVLTITSVAGCNSTNQSCTSFTGTVPAANPNGAYTLAASGSAVALDCTGPASQPCQRSDIMIAFVH